LLEAAGCHGTFGSIRLIGGYQAATCSPIVTGMIVDHTGSFPVAPLIGAGIACSVSPHSCC
jgi:hypothetical protein